MRFEQLKRESGSVIRKKLYKKGKMWIVASALSFAGGIVLLGTTTNNIFADTVNSQDTVVSNIQSDSTATGETNTADSTKEITTTVNVQTNLGTITMNATGKAGETIQLNVPDKTGYTPDKNTINVAIDADGTATTTDMITYTLKDANENNNVDQNGDENDTKDSNSLSTLNSSPNIQKSTDDSLNSSSRTEGVNSGIQATAADDSTNLAAGYNGTSQWYINENGDLHIGAGNFNDPSSLDSDYWVGVFAGSGFSRNDAESLQTKITKIILDGNIVAPINSTELFGEFTNLTEIENLNSLDTSKVTNMGMMFMNDSSLTSLDLSKFDMSEVIKTDDDSSDPIPSGTDQMFDGTKLSSITLGAKNKFMNNVSLPNALNADWVNIGTGTIDFPQGNLNFTETAPSLSTLYDGNGKTGTETFVPYDASKVKGSLTIHSNLGDKVVDNITGKIGNSIDVNVPAVEGYKADKTIVKATVNADGTITTTDFVTYTKITSGGSGSNEGSSSNLKIVDKSQLVSTYPDKNEVTLYKLDGSKLTPIKNRALAAGTDWYSDKVVILGSGDDAVKYVRVATDEWMKLSDGYRYENKKLVVTTNNDNMTQLLKSEAVPVTNRALGPRSSWLVDRIGYLDTSDNPKGFYRVATNEFVDPDNVSI